MMNVRRLWDLDPSQRGALALVATLLVMLAATIAGAVHIYTQLDRTAQVQRRLVYAQEQLFKALDAQYNEENSLHGYTRTGTTYFLGPSLGANDDFVAAIADLERTTKRLGIPDATDSAIDMLKLHQQWERQVEEPLMAKPPPKDPDQLYATGKYLLDQLRGEAQHIGTLLDDHVTEAQRDLVWRINETLGVAMLAVTVFAGLGLLFVRSRRRMLARLERERRIIETLQGAFRTGWDELPRSRVGTAYISATRDASVGGDLFDVRRLDENRGLVIVADISGKGIEAAVNTAFVKYSIRTLAMAHDDPATILEAFNRMFLDTIKDPGLFVVAFVGIFDARTMRLDYASAGHSGAYLRRAGDVTQLDVTAPVIGLDRDFASPSKSITLEPRDLLVLATDGLTEARDRHGEPLDDAGAIGLVRDGPTDPQACADELVAAVRRRSGGQLRDDLALLVIRVDEQRRSGAAADAAA